MIPFQQKHGGSAEKNVIDFSANTSPLGMHPASVRAISSAALSSSLSCEYPDSECKNLRSLLGKFWSFPETQIVCGNGASELIYMATFSFAHDCAVVFEPAFSEYESALKNVSNLGRKIRIEKIFSVEEISCIPSETSVLFAASPSNPLGTLLSFAEISALEKKCESVGAVFVLDACFSQFSSEGESVVRKIIERKNEFPNLLVLNAFTKFYGMAGIRLGYALCFSEKISSLLKENAQPWSVNFIAQKCGEAVLKSELSSTDFEKESWSDRIRSLVKIEKEKFYNFFFENGIFFFRSEANFITFRFDFPAGTFSSCSSDSSVVEIASFCFKNKPQKLQLRSCSDFDSLGPSFHRIAIKSPSENAVLLSFLRSVMKNENSGNSTKSQEKSSEESKQKSRAKCVMIQGTMSSSGKSLVVAALCRIFMKDGFRVAPFKSQNMALNSGVTFDGKEMGRAQIMQAEAAGILPDVRMNPVLLKPNSDTGSQIIVNGIAVGSMNARDFFSFRKNLVPKIMESYESLSEENDIIVIEGAGSPAEINLKENDIVNMGLASLVDAPVIVVGDIDRGGVFASLYGTFSLVSENERNRIKGFLVNKFRGDVSLLENGLAMLEDLTDRKVLGVVPFMKNLRIDDEDSLSDSLSKKTDSKTEEKLIKISVVALPYMSNFTDLNNFARLPFVDVKFFDSIAEFDFDSDLLVIPGSKNSVKAMEFLNEAGLSEPIKSFALTKPVVGICGGFQVLGELLDDSFGNEDSSAKKIAGLNLLPVKTTFTSSKTLVQVSSRLPKLSGFFDFLSGKKASGYEIHQGFTNFSANDSDPEKIIIAASANVLGTYIHGFFDSREIVGSVLEKLAESKNVRLPDFSDFKSEKEKEFDRLEKTVRENIDLKKVYEILGIEK